MPSVDAPASDGLPVAGSPVASLRCRIAFVDISTRFTRPNPHEAVCTSDDSSSSRPGSAATASPRARSRTVAS
ncbi:hypothetical protein DJ84_11230, partial [Halorubrum ezzemoulense]